jgi:hypothetical protein
MHLWRGLCLLIVKDCAFEDGQMIAAGRVKRPRDYPSCSDETGFS